MPAGAALSAMTRVLEGAPNDSMLKLRLDPSPDMEDNEQEDYFSDCGSHGSPPQQVQQLTGKVTCYRQGAKSAEMLYITLGSDCLLMGPRCNVACELFMLPGHVARSAGSMVMLMEENLVKLRLFMNNGEEARRWSTAINVAATHRPAPADGGAAQKARVDVQTRAWKRRSRAKKILSTLTGVVMHKTSRTEKWQRWKSMSNPAVAEVKAGAKLSGNVEYFRRESGMKKRAPRHICLRGDVLCIGLSAAQQDESLVLTGTTTVTSGNMVSVWEKGDVLVARFWTQYVEEAMQWATAFEEASGLVGGHQPSRSPKRSLAVETRRKSDNKPSQTRNLIMPTSMGSKVVCYCTGDKCTRTRFIAIADTALVIGPRANVAEDVIPLHGVVAAASGNTVALWRGSAIIFRFWLPDAKTAARWASTVTVSAQRCHESGIGELQAIIQKQKRAVRSRSRANKFFGMVSCFSHTFCGGAKSSTTQWMRWKGSGASLKDFAATQDELPCSLTTEARCCVRGSKLADSTEERFVSLTGDVLVVRCDGKRGAPLQEVIVLQGMGVTSSGAMVSLWSKDKLIVRLWFQNTPETARWGSALTDAVRLFSPTPPKEPISGFDLESRDGTETESIAPTDFTGAGSCRGGGFRARRYHRSG